MHAFVRESHFPSGTNLASYTPLHVLSTWLCFDFGVLPLDGTKKAVNNERETYRRKTSFAWELCREVLITLLMSRVDIIAM